MLTQTGTLTPFGYAGQYTDSEAGLQYPLPRYYDPATQQFLTVDPLLAQTDQAYAYAGGSPTNATDPSGLDNLTEKCKKLEKTIENLKFSIERAERNLDLNKASWADNNPARIAHIATLAASRVFLAVREAQYAAECCNNNQNPQPVPVPVPGPVPVPTPQLSSQSYSGAIPGPVPVPAPTPFGVPGYSGLGDNDFCDAVVKTAGVTAGAAGTALAIDWLWGLGALILVAP